MNPPLRKIFYWSARLLGIVMALTIARTHLQAVNFNLPFSESLMSLISHLWLTFILAAALVIAWRWEIIGAAIYILIAGYMVLDMGKTDLIYYFIFPAPFVIIAVLFLISGLSRAPKPKNEKGGTV